MEEKKGIMGYITNPSEYIETLKARAQEREWPEGPSTEILTSDLWEAYVKQVYEDGLKVGKADFSTDYEGECD